MAKKTPTDNLETPIVAPRPERLFFEPLFDPAAAEQRARSSVNKVVVSERLRKLDLLKERYGAPAEQPLDPWVVRFALDYVPGMRVVMPPSGRGQPSKWKPERLLQLLADVENCQSSLGLRSDKEAIEYLVSHHSAWGAPRANHDRWTKTLKNRLSQAREFHRTMHMTLLERAIDLGLM